jgi:hypothetical protein
MIRLAPSSRWVCQRGSIPRKQKAWGEPTRPCLTPGPAGSTYPGRVRAGHSTRRHAGRPRSVSPSRTGSRGVRSEGPGMGRSQSNRLDVYFSPLPVKSQCGLALVSSMNRRIEGAGIVHPFS